MHDFYPLKNECKIDRLPVISEPSPVYKEEHHQTYIRIGNHLFSFCNSQLKDTFKIQI